MTHKRIQDILPFVERPSRYLGTEVNRRKKDLSKATLKFALAFPDLYEIGTSHFGMQILYHILNHHADIAAERVFAPAEDMEALLRSSRMPLMSLESRYPLKKFDIIGFSLLYELNYTNILTMLDLSDIPFFASQRGDSDPLIIAGGPCTCNPEPVADFFDAMVIGDGERVIIEMAAIWMRLKLGGGIIKKTILQEWSRLEGVYVPAFYKVSYDASGHQVTQHKNAPWELSSNSIRRAIVSDLNRAPFPVSPVIPYGRPVHDRLRIEVSRGCSRGCRFCQAGMIYRPVRERSVETLMSLCQACIQATGYEDISLLSLSTSDYSNISALIHELMHRYAGEHISISLPSFRAGTLTPELMRLIKKVRKTGFTIAPEAGSQRMRNVINKNIKTDEIVCTVEDAFNAGWRVIKLYFMVGLPTETSHDIIGIVDLVKTLRKIKGPGGRHGKLNVSVATFIPKPHTPFQWAPQISLEASRERLNQLKKKLNLPGVQFKWQHPKVSFLEGLWTRGDRRLSRLLVAAYGNGCRFDGWSDRFNYDAWEKSFSEADIDVDFYTTRLRQLEEPLPWDHIDSRIDKQFLIEEWHRALAAEKTADCRWDHCHQCGVCDFDSIAPRLFENIPDNRKDKTTGKKTSAKPLHIKIMAIYSKSGSAKFLGHLELMNAIIRSLRRAGISLVYSKGFHPMPKISFDDPLPIGIEGRGERFFMMVCGSVDLKGLAARINKDLPRGLLINRLEIVKKNSRANRMIVDHYRVTLAKGIFDAIKLGQFLRAKEFIITRKNKKGTVNTLDLRQHVLSATLNSPKSLDLSIRTIAGKRIRPGILLENVFELSTSEIKQARIVKGSQYV